MSEHTPTPWAVVGTDPAEGVDCWWIVSPGILGEIGTVRGSQNDPEQQANAAFIVRACNFHERLVDTLAYLHRSVEENLLSDDIDSLTALSDARDLLNDLKKDESQ